MPFLRNAWHMIGWSTELPEGQGKFVHRTLSNEPILVYRLQNGEPAAIKDRCAHRFVPLHLGKQIGDTIQCGYHGLCFGADGRCVSNPVDGAPIPKAAKVRAYPIVERYGILWVWLGEPEKADDCTIPDYGFLVDPKRGTVAGHMLTKANYQLVIDNLTDLTHIQFVHSEYQGSEAFPRIRNEVRQEGDTVYANLTFPNGKPPSFFVRALKDPEQPIDLIYEVRWNAPSNAKLTARAYVPGDRSTPLFELYSAHIVSAETETTCHYFFGNSRDFAIGDPAVDAHVREWQRIGFNEQDKPMLEAQQLSVGDDDIMTLGPVLLATDAGPVRVRRVLKSLMAKEAESTSSSNATPALA